MNQNWKSHLALLMANFLYGINYVIAKGIMPDYFSPEALVFLRIMPSVMLFWLVGCLVKSAKPNKSDYKNLFLAGLFGVFLNQYLFIKGLNFSSPIDASVIITSNPILVLVVAAIALKEKITALKITGIVLGAVGALMLIVGKGFGGFDIKNISGDLLLLANATAFAIYMVFAKPLMQKFDSVFVLKWTFLFGALLYFPIGVGEFVRINWSHVNNEAFVGLLYIVLATTVLTYFLMNYALRHLKSTTVSVYIYVQPVVAGITAIVAGMDKLTPVNITASVLVFAGVYLVSILK